MVMENTLQPWNKETEKWWHKKVKEDFHGDVLNAIQHMPDAAQRRMEWLEETIDDLTERF
jgi:hypothetical protein